MKIEGRAVLSVFALFSAGILYCQEAKQKQGVGSEIHFGKFSPDVVSNATINEIAVSDSLFMKPGTNALPCKIASFDVYVLSGKVGITETAFSNRLSKKQKTLISKIRPGQIVYIQNIVVKYPGKEKVKCNSKFIFKVRY